MMLPLAQFGGPGRVTSVFHSEEGFQITPGIDDRDTHSRSSLFGLGDRRSDCFLGFFLAHAHGVLLWMSYRSMGSGALAATSFWSRSSRQKSSGMAAASAARSSAIRSGRLAPGMTAAEAG